MVQNLHLVVSTIELICYTTNMCRRGGSMNKYKGFFKGAAPQESNISS